MPEWLTINIEVFMSEIKVLLGKRIKELRNARNLTQEGLSELTNIGISSISKIESGIYHPTDDNLEKIAQALNVEPYMLYICKHNKSRSEIIKEITLIINNASDEELKLAYKVLLALIN